MMVEYEVILSKDFKADLDKISEYIPEVLMAPESAAKIVDDIVDLAASLSFMPERFAAVKEPFGAKGRKRRALCGNYAIYYTVDKSRRKVYVIQAIRKGRDAPRLMRA